MMMKWPTSHNRKSKERSKVKNEAIWKATAAPHSAPCMSQSCRHKQMFEKRNDPEHLDGLTDKTTRRKHTSEKQIRLGTNQTRPRRIRKISATDPDSRKMEIAWVGLMSHGVCHTFPLAVLLASLVPFFLLLRI